MPVVPHSQSGREAPGSGGPPTAFDYASLARDRFGQRTSRRGGIGIQGRVILAFMGLLVAALGTSAYVFVREASQQTADLVGENARQLAASLALSSGSALEAREADSLKRFGDDLIKSRNILFVSFIGPQGESVALSSRDLDHAAHLPITLPDPQSLMLSRPTESPVFGTHLQVAAPVFTLAHPTTKPAQTSGRALLATSGPPVQPSPRLIGYVQVGVSYQREQAQLQRIAWWVACIGAGIVLFLLPLAYTLIHRIFLPIRKLVDATRRITAGDLDTQVAVDRKDLIGDLARSFNEMVQWVRKQQFDLATMNAALGKANRDLETRIEQRTSQLETANKRLSGEIAEKEDFLRAVSHDLNAPLRNIDGMVTMLLMKKREQLDEDTVARLERVKKNVEVETDLIAELLELSRIKTRRQKMEAVDLEKMLWELRGLFENDLKTRSIDLIIDTSLPMLNCERARIRQVFQNLIDNAIKYMGDGPRREIHVGAIGRLTEAEFYIRDTGIGIHPEDVDKVFYVFRRGKNTAATNVAGKGVGLASVKSIVETYSGRIWVESQLGEGTTFRFTVNGQYVPSTGGVLPTNQPDDDEDEQTPPPAAKAA
jgi:signal transduction histidine kinase